MLIEMDIVGLALVVGGMVCYTLALQWGGISKAWKSADVIGCLVGFGLIFIAFGVVEGYQGENAMLHGRIIRRRTVWTGTVFAFL